MRNPPILRTVVTDIHGDTLYDSADQPRRRIVSCKPLIVKRYEPHQPIHAVDPSSARLRVLIAAVAITLVVVVVVIVAAVVSV